MSESDHDKELARQVAKLKRVIHQLVLTSKDFAELRHLLRDEAFELQVYLIPLAVGSEVATTYTTEEELRFEITTADEEFLKRAGLRFDEP